MIKVFDDSATPEKLKELTESYSVEDAKRVSLTGNKQMRTLRVADLEAKRVRKYPDMCMLLVQNSEFR